MLREKSKTFDSGLIKWKVCFLHEDWYFPGRLKQEDIFFKLNSHGKFCLFAAIDLYRLLVSCALVHI